MDLLFHVGNAGSGRILAGLARACARRGTRFAVFFTHDGVQLLDAPEVRDAVAAAARAAVCEHSWQRYRGDAACPVELASQTLNSELAGEAARVVSL
ncbi:MAG: hypothetical protein N2544_15025 [Burkholderiales bacterium]|nr:hypothetical protein [Burkholderiales bacterium]